MSLRTTLRVVVFLVLIATLTTATANAKGSLEILRDKGKKSGPAVTEEGKQDSKLLIGETGCRSSVTYGIAM